MELVNKISGNDTYHGYKIKDLAVIAVILEDEGVSPEFATQYVKDIKKSYEILEADFHNRIAQFYDDYIKEERL